MSTSSQQCLNNISQGEKTPRYYKTARNYLTTTTNAQRPRVPQPMGNQPIPSAHPTRNHQQPIPPPVSQSVESHVSYAINPQPTLITQVPITVPPPMNATSTSMSQSCAIPNSQTDTIAQSYVTQTLPTSHSLTTPQSVCNIPENTMLPMLNPWQKQSMFERKISHQITK